ncbi:MAG: aminoglycoside phosphotransferase family protein [Acidobacteriia bacterium]|nr:aminoglycoside phosphotransferase family protein [Terriglobia bacterium]
MEPQEQSDRETCRVIVLGRNREDVLLRVSQAGFFLPSVEVPRWQRLAEHLTAGLRRDLGRGAVCLFTPKNPSSRSETNGTHYEVMECWHDEGRAGGGVWNPIGSLTERSFQDKAEFQILEQCLRESDCYERDTSSPFAKRGWLAELRNWTAEIIQPLGLELTGQFCQYNASPSFSLIRFETNGPAVWFKAVGEPNQREFPITLKLAELFPMFTPEILGTQPKWNGWLSREAAGTNLGDTKETAKWERTAADLARLQLRSISQSELILNSGAHDLRPDTLLASADPFFDLVAQLMEEQTKIPPPALSRQELNLLKLRIQDSLTLLEELRIPSGLGHLDLNPGNIIVSADQCRFVDWAEAYVGHPFFSFQYLLEHFRRAVVPSPETESRLMEAYKAPWQNLVPADVVDEALMLAPLAAVFAYAAGTGAWRDQQRLRDQNLAGYFRSLARRMNREAIQFIERRSPCLS